MSKNNGSEKNDCESWLRERIVFFAILAVALILRLISLNQSLWLDEAIQVWASSSFTPKNLLSQYMPGDFNPPLFHLLLHEWIRLFGTSVVFVRMISVAFSLGSLGIIWKLGKEIFPKKDGVDIRVTAATLLLATSPLYLYYSQEARMYMLASFLALLTAWRFQAFLKKQDTTNSIIFAVSILSMSFSHYLTLLTLPVFGLFGLWELRKKHSVLKSYLLLALPFMAVLAAFIFYWPILHSQLHQGLLVKLQFPVWGKTVGSFTLKAMALLPVKFIIGRIDLDNKVVYGLVSVFLVTISWGSALLGTIKNFAIKKNKKKVSFRIVNYSILLISLLLFLPPVFGFLISFFVPVFSYFRFLFLLPFFYLLVVEGVFSIKRIAIISKTPQALFVFLISLNVICSGAYLAFPSFHRENWRGLVDWVQTRNQNYGAPVLIIGEVAKPFEYYDNGKSNLKLISVDTQLSDKVKNWNTFFLVSYGLPIFDPNDKIRNSLSQLGYSIRKGESFNQVGIEEWRTK